MARLLRTLFSIAVLSTPAIAARSVMEGLESTGNSINVSTTNASVSIGSGGVRFRPSSLINYIGLKAPSSIAASLMFTLPGVDGAAGNVLTTDGAGTWYWSAGGGGGGSNHNLLSATHPDTVAGAAVRGSMIVGNSTPAWTKLAIGASGTYLRSNGTDPAWSALQASEIPGGATSYIQLRGTLQSGATFYTSSGTVITLNVQSIKYADNTIQVSSPPAAGTAIVLTSSGVPFGGPTGSVTTDVSNFSWNDTSNILYIGAPYTPQSIYPSIHVRGLSTSSSGDSKMLVMSSTGPQNNSYVLENGSGTITSCVSGGTGGCVPGDVGGDVSFKINLPVSNTKAFRFNDYSTELLKLQATASILNTPFKIGSASTTINNLTYQWPSTQAAGNLQNDGAGNLTWTAAAGTGDITAVNAGYGLTGGGTSGDVTLNLSGNTTSYVRNTSSLQSGTTFYVSSGTVTTSLNLPYLTNTNLLYASNGQVSSISNATSIGGELRITGDPNGTADLSLLRVESFRLTGSGNVIGGSFTAGESGNIGNVYALQGFATPFAGSTGYGVYGQCWGSGVSTCHGVYAFATNGGNNNYALYAHAEGATNNYAIYSAAGSNYYVGGSTFTGNVYISSGVLLNGSAGSSGQVLQSNGPGTVPSWVTPSAGGGGGASTLETLFGNVRSSPTLTIRANAPFTGSVVGSTNTLGVDYSSFTMVGPNVIKLQATLQSGATFFVSSGTINNAIIQTGRIDSTLNFKGSGGTQSTIDNPSASPTFSHTRFSATQVSMNTSVQPARSFAIWGNSAPGNLVLKNFDDSRYVAITASNTFNYDHQYILPDSTGTVGQVLAIDHIEATADPYTGLQKVALAWKTDATGGSGGGDSLGNHTATMTITAPYGIQASTVVATGGITASSITVSGSGAARLRWLMGTDSAESAAISGYINTWASSSSNTVMANFNGVVGSSYSVVWSSITPTPGYAAYWTQTGPNAWTLGATPFPAGGGGSTGGSIVASPQYQVPYYDQPGSTTSVVGNPNFTMDTTSMTIRGSSITLRNMLFDGQTSSMTVSSFTATYVNGVVPGLVQGTNITITGTWPNQTINSTGGSGGGDNLGSHVATMTLTAPYGAVISTAVITTSATVNGPLTVASAKVNALTPSRPVGSDSNSNLATIQIDLASANHVVNVLGVGNLPTTIDYINSTQTVTANKIYTSSGGVNITYGLVVGSMTGAGLTTCGSSSQAQSYDATTGKWGCTTITAAGIGALTGNQTITISGDGSGSGTTAITLTVADDSHNHTGSTLSSIVGATITSQIPSGVLVSTVSFLTSTQTYSGAKTFSSPSGVNIGYGVVASSGLYLTSSTVNGQFTAGSYFGGGLATCGDSSHAVGWSGGQWTCQSITGSAAAGGVHGNLQYNNAGGISGIPQSFVGVSSITISTGGVGGLDFYTSTAVVTSSFTASGNTTVFASTAIISAQLNVMNEITFNGKHGYTDQLMASSGSAVAPQWGPIYATIITTSNFTSTNNTPVNIPQLYYNLIAGATYQISCTLIQRSTATAVGIGAGLFVTAGSTVSASVRTIVAADGTAGSFDGLLTSAGDSVLGAGVAVANSDVMTVIQGVIRVGAAGNLNVTAVAEVGGGQVTTQAGSMCEIDGRPPQ